MLRRLHHYFHAAHPLRAAEQFFLDFLGEGVHNLEHLVAAMKYIGSLFIGIRPGAGLLFSSKPLCA